MRIFLPPKLDLFTPPPCMVLDAFPCFGGFPFQNWEPKTTLLPLLLPQDPLENHRNLSSRSLDIFKKTS